MISEEQMYQEVYATLLYMLEIAEKLKEKGSLEVVEQVKTRIKDLENKAHEDGITLTPPLSVGVIKY